MLKAAAMPFRIVKDGVEKMNNQRLIEAAIIAIVTATITTWANTQILDAKLSEMRASVERRLAMHEAQIDKITRDFYRPNNGRTND